MAVVVWRFRLPEIDQSSDAVRVLRWEDGELSGDVITLELLRIDASRYEGRHVPPASWATDTLTAAEHLRDPDSVSLLLLGLPAVMVDFTTDLPIKSPLPPREPWSGQAPPGAIQ